MLLISALPAQCSDSRSKYAGERDINKSIHSSITRPGEGLSLPLSQFFNSLMLI